MSSNFSRFSLGALVLTLTLLSAPRTALAQTETQHVLNLPWKLTPRTELVLHSRFRTRPESQGLYQGRTGAILNVSIPWRTTVIAGYYFTEEEESSADWEALNRLFGGLEFNHLRWKGEWTSRHLAESFNGPGNVHYYRIRHRFGWEAPTRVAPFSNVEILWDEKGWRSTRYQAGNVWKVSPRFSWDIHYFYEPRRSTGNNSHRHMFGTTFEIKVGSLEPQKP